MDAGLSDYKTNTFVDDNSSPLSNYLGDKLTSGEQEFVKIYSMSVSGDTKMPIYKSRDNNYNFVDGPGRVVMNHKK